MLPPADADRHFLPAQFRIRVASDAWELAGCRALRRAVFCAEQGIFAGDDSDPLDAAATMLAAVSCVAGIGDQVVGTVRIHRDAPGRWSGSRLAVHRHFRRVAGIGTELIRLAVGTAHAHGCRDFRAHVQEANVALFESLHWRGLAMVTLHGRPHALMQADLAHYPPHAAGDIQLVPPLRRAA